MIDEFHTAIDDLPTLHTMRVRRHRRLNRPATPAERNPDRAYHKGTPA